MDTNTETANLTAAIREFANWRDEADFYAEPGCSDCGGTGVVYEEDEDGHFAAECGCVAKRRPDPDEEREA